MLYMIVEEFREANAVPVYRRLRDRGRGFPDGIVYVGSWVSTDLSRCYQVLESEGPEPIEEWIAAWSDLIDFEVVPVVSSDDAAALVAPRL